MQRRRHKHRFHLSSVQTKTYPIRSGVETGMALRQISGRCVQSVCGHQDVVTCLGHSESTATGHCYLASGGRDGLVCLWIFDTKSLCLFSEHRRFHAYLSVCLTICPSLIACILFLSVSVHSPVSSFRLSLDLYLSLRSFSAIFVSLFYPSLCLRDLFLSFYTLPFACTSAFYTSSVTSYVSN